MKKEHMREQMLITNTNKVYRILRLDVQVCVIDFQKQTMPIWKKYEEFNDYVEMEEPTIEEPDAVQKKVAYQRYHMISDIIPSYNVKTKIIDFKPFSLIIYLLN